jgi:pimeloyl-ACP methyl ester carboxylesterase
MVPSVPQKDPTFAEVNGITIAYDTFGDPADPALMLIMGLGCPMIDWKEEFCSQLASHGYWVIRFDNRDVGLSTWIDGAGMPDLPAMLKGRLEGKAVESQYTLLDMTADAVGLLDVLEIEAAHVLGLSMGGGIAQLMALHYPERLISLTTIMSSTGEPDLPPAKPEALALLTRPYPKGRDGYIEMRLESHRVLAGPNYPVDEQEAREHAGRRYDRGVTPEGYARQYAAILAAQGIREALKSVAIPTLVIHGDVDPLVPVECGMDTANSVPGSKLLIIEGMGHSWPPSLWPRLIEAIVEHARESDSLSLKGRG